MNRRGTLAVLSRRGGLFGLLRLLVLTLAVQLVGLLPLGQRVVTLAFDTYASECSCCEDEPQQDCPQDCQDDCPSGCRNCHCPSGARAIPVAAVDQVLPVSPLVGTITSNPAARVPSVPDLPSLFRPPRALLVA